MVRDIRNMEMAMGEYRLETSDVVAASRIKLERSVATNRNIPKGDIIAEADLHMLSPGDGYKWSEIDRIVGKMAILDIPKNEIIYPHMLQS